MDASKRSKEGNGSLEGHALPVSTTPHAWQEIARLGCSPVKQLEREKGEFVDVHAFPKAGSAYAGQLDLLHEWAKAEDLLHEERRYRAWFYDSEADEWQYLLMNSWDFECPARRHFIAWNPQAGNAPQPPCLVRVHRVPLAFQKYRNSTQ